MRQDPPEGEGEVVMAAMEAFQARAAPRVRQGRMALGAEVVTAWMLAGVAA
jgi:hypothetical protein